MIGRANLCLILFCLSLGLVGCVHMTTTKDKPVEIQLVKSSFDDLNQWGYDTQYEALQAFKRSCKIFIRQDPDQPISNLTRLGGKVQDWVAPCKDVLDSKITNSDLARKFFERWFIPYLVKDITGTSTGKFTGYYEIELRGSLKKTKKYQHPVYACPQDIDIIRGTSSISHRAINNGALKNKGLELVYVDNKARLLFMHIQGSGIVHLAGGGQMKLGYACKNGHPYLAIGPLFKDYAKTRIHSGVDMMHWLHTNPKEATELTEQNQSYVFFKQIHGETPIGGQGIPLTAERSMAIDYKLYPYGVPMWLETESPKIDALPSIPYNRLMIAQDTGGAIKGAIRGDIFYGRGKIAEKLACTMNKSGLYYVLFPKTVFVPSVYKSN